MKIAISALGNNLDSPVDFRFGRCAYFIFVEIDEKQKEIKNFEAVQNLAAQAFRGAGMQAAQLVASKGAKAVITGRIGPNAFAMLNMAGVRVFICPPTISVKQAIEKFINNELQELTANQLQFGFGGFGGFGRGWRGGAQG